MLLSELCAAVGAEVCMLYRLRAGVVPTVARAAARAAVLGLASGCQP
jgi:preprotein translocase subunit SecD